MEKNDAPREILSADDGYAPLNPLCTRRQTLIWGGASMIGWSALRPAFALGADRPLILMEKAQGMVIADPVLCVGCGRCELACTEFNDGKASPSLARIKIARNLNFGPQGAATWRAGHGNMGDGLVVQDLCRQCPHPVPCANICPENAIILAPENNARLIDPEKCTGCRICLRACPWEMISYDPDSRKATKCHLCGGRPKCAEACPAGALTYVPWRDLTGTTPHRNLSTAKLPPQRSQGCQECHLPGQGQNVREVSARIRRALGGGRAFSQAGLGFKWIDMAGAVLVPVAIGAVLVHAVLRKVWKR